MMNHVRIHGVVEEMAEKLLLTTNSIKFVTLWQPSQHYHFIVTTQIRMSRVNRSVAILVYLGESTT